MAKKSDIIKTELELAKETINSIVVYNKVNGKITFPYPIKWITNEVWIEITIAEEENSKIIATIIPMSEISKIEYVFDGGELK